MSSGDEASYVDYVGARWSALYRTAHLLSGNSHEAEDVLQMTLIKVFAQWAKVSSADSPDAYVRRMMINEFLGTRRRTTRRSQRDHLVVAPHSDDTDLDERIDVWTQLRSLPPRQRAVLVLRYYEDLSEAQIAETLGCSRGTVKSQAHDALRTLRERLADEEMSR